MKMKSGKVLIGIHPMGPQNFSDRWETALRAQGAEVKALEHWDSGLNWHDGPLWPEDAHVDVFLVNIRSVGASRT